MQKGWTDLRDPYSLTWTKSLELKKLNFNQKVGKNEKDYHTHDRFDDIDSLRNASDIIPEGDSADAWSCFD